MWEHHSSHTTLAEAQGVADWIRRDNPNYTVRVWSSGKLWNVDQFKIRTN